MRIDGVSSQMGIAATIGDIDAAGDEPQLRAGVLRAREAVAAELATHTPTLTLAAAWSEVIRQSVATAVGVGTRRTRRPAHCGAGSERHPPQAHVPGVDVVVPLSSHVRT